MTPRIGLVSAWASRLGGGVFEAVLAQIAIIRASGFEPVMFALEDEQSAADRGRFGDTEVVVCPVMGPRSPGYAPRLVSSMMAAKLDLVHLHGIWLYPSMACSRWAAATGKPYVISPHGMLDPWIVSRGVAKKKIAQIGYERRSWRRATLFHALTGAEQADITRTTGRDAVTVIPNAVLPGMVGAASRRPIVLSLGRIHPKKNIDALIDGWYAAEMAKNVPGAQLVIAGWGEDDHVAALRARLSSRAGEDIRFVGPLFGEAKQQALSEARYLALASHSEGLPMAILEAWIAGTPTLMSRNCNLPEGFEGGAAIDCGTDAEAVAAALRRAFAFDEEKWRRMSDSARSLAVGPFSPETVTTRWARTYSDLLATADGARAA